MQGAVSGGVPIPIITFLLTLRKVPFHCERHAAYGSYKSLLFAQFGYEIDVAFVAKKLLEVLLIFMNARLSRLTERLLGRCPRRLYKLIGADQTSCTTLRGRNEFAVAKKIYFFSHAI